MNDMNKLLMAGVATAALLGANAAYAGSIVLTGHDNDFHFHNGPGPGVGGAAGNALVSEVTFALVGLGTTTPTAAEAATPLLTFDQGTQLTSALATLGFTNVTNISTIAGITPAVFDHTKYGAMVVASESTCGGCDNSAAFIAALATAPNKAAIGTFFNDGSGIASLAGATDPNAYAYVPDAATNPGGSPPSTGYFTTAAGVTPGLPALNGHTTHNFFSEPGTPGLSASYVVTERCLATSGAPCSGTSAAGTPETVAVKGGTTTCIVNGTCVTPTPEPATLGILGAGLFGLAAIRRRKRQSAS